MDYLPKSRPRLDGLSIDNIWRELEEIRNTLNSLQVDHIEYRTNYKEPDKPRNNQMYYADGTSWNPGYGAGLYIYIGGAWHPVVIPTTSARPTAALLTLTSYAPLVTRDKVEPIPYSTLTLTSYAPFVHVGIKYIIPKGSLTLTGAAPTITVTP